MQDETRDLSLWDRSLLAARWCRDQFAGWFATTWLYLILWTVVAITFGVLLYIDGKFSRSLAEGVEAIDPLSFQMMGWAYRLFAAAFLMAAARCAYKGIKGKWTFRGLGLFASIIVCLHAFGFGFEALSDRRDQAVAVREIVETKTASKEDLIAALEARKVAIDGDMAAAVAPLNAEITQYITDGKNNDHLADDSRVRRNALQDKATAEKADIDKEIMALMREASNGKVEGVQVNADAKPWAPLFIGIAQLATWTKEPTDWSIYLCAIGFVIFWVLLGESLVIFLPERIYTMHLHDAGKRDVTEALSDELPAGHARWEGPEEELEAMLRGKAVHDNIKGGAKKAARTRRVGNKIEANDEYFRDKIAGWMVAHNEGIATSTIANTSGLTVAQMKTTYGPYMQPEEFDALFYTKAAPEPEPEATEDEADPADVETEAPEPEPPKDWHVALYDPEANDTEQPEDEEAA
jgi:hypothetical protein